MALFRVSASAWNSGVVSMPSNSARSSWSSSSLVSTRFEQASPTSLSLLLALLVWLRDDMPVRDASQGSAIRAGAIQVPNSG
jgi:hypothetical protein